MAAGGLEALKSRRCAPARIQTYLNEDQVPAKIDLNVDAGESFGPWQMGDDERVFPLVSTVNIACGFHAGDPCTMYDTLNRAKVLRLAVGAHPGLPDLLGFGRRAIAVGPRAVHDGILYQLGALSGIARSLDMQLSHVKMHGALTAPVGEEPGIAEAIIRAVREFDENMAIFVIPGTAISTVAAKLGHPTVAEGLPERGYLPNGHLAPRNTAGAVITDPDVAAQRALEMAAEGTVTAIDGTVVRIAPQSLGIHGDNPNVVAIASRIRSVLYAAGITITADRGPDAILWRAEESTPDFR
jgi:UPF0271 protein